MIVGSQNIRYQCLIDLADELNDGIDMINSIFSVQTIPLFIVFLLNLIFSSFGVLKLLVDNYFLKPDFWFSIVFITYFVILIMLITYYSTNTTNEALKTPHLINKILLTQIMSPRDEKLIMQFLSHYRCRNFEMKNEFFNINWRLFVSVRNI